MVKSILFAVFVVLMFAHVGLCSDSATQTIRMSVREACVIDTEQDHVSFAGTGQTQPGDSEADTREQVVYSKFSVLAPAGDAHTITAAFDRICGQPAGCTVILDVRGPEGEDGRMTGESIVLSPDARRILSTVGSCATGTGSAQGVRLEYRLEPGDKGATASEIGVSKVLMTITDAS